MHTHTPHHTYMQLAHMYTTPLTHTHATCTHVHHTTHTTHLHCTPYIHSHPQSVRRQRRSLASFKMTRDCERPERQPNKPETNMLATPQKSLCPDIVSPLCRLPLSIAYIMYMCSHLLPSCMYVRYFIILYVKKVLCYKYMYVVRAG